nr:unnamed protein product [Callosobruchus analis]
MNLMNDFKLAPKDWHNYLRKDEDTYLKSLSLVAPLIEIKGTFERNVKHNCWKVSAIYQLQRMRTNHRILHIHNNVILEHIALSCIQMCTPPPILQTYMLHYMRNPYVKVSTVDMENLPKEGHWVVEYHPDTDDRRYPAHTVRLPA